MKLFANPTSPFVRVVRTALLEKGLGNEVEVAMVDAWADAPEFLDANPAGRVPALVTTDGVRLTEATLILQYLEAVRPEPSVLPQGPDAAERLSRAGLAIGIFEAAVSIIIGRKSGAGFDEGLVGRKRYRTMRDGFARLDAMPHSAGSDTLDLADIAAITALDYVVFRFPDGNWRAAAPRLAAWRDGLGSRRSVAETVPRG